MKRTLYSSRVPKTATLDVELLCLALRTMIRHFEVTAKEAGYAQKFITAVAEPHYALINRIEINMPETELRRTK